MQRLVAGDLDVEDARGPLDRCLGCRACETACPSDVQYGELLEIARDGGAQTPSLQVRALLSLVRRPRLLGARAARRPAARALRARRRPGRSGQALDAHADVNWERRNPGGPRAVVLRGCVMREAFGERPAGGGRRARERPATTSSPAPSRAAAARSTCTTASSRPARRCASSCSPACPQDAILVSTSAGCGAALRAHDERVLDLSEALVHAPAPPQGSGGGPVAVFDACHLLHAQGVREAPRELLRGAGYEPVELAGNGRCCGAAGVYAFTQPELSQQLAQSRVEAIRASGARTVSCGNPGCALQLRSALREAGLDVRVAHPAELAVEAALRRPERPAPGAGGVAPGAGGVAWRRCRRRRATRSGRRDGRRRRRAGAERDQGTSRSAGESISKNSRFRKPNMPGEDGRGERLDARVVALHVAVVDAARAGDLILGVRQLGLQLLEVLGRAQLRVGLGDGEQAAERSAQLALGLGDLSRRRGAAGLRAHGVGARLRDGLEDLALVRRIALDGLDQVRDQVVPALELDVDPAPGLVDAVAPPDHAVVDPDQEQDEKRR